VTSELQAAVEELYREFAHYPLNLRMVACECCVDPQTYANLFDGKLSELEPEQLRHFASQAATTWGTRDDYRHFLPRIFEVMATGAPLDIGFEAWLQASKLEYTGWRKWPHGERAGVEAFWKAWFNEVVSRNLDADRYNQPGANDLIEAMASIGIDIAPLLEQWSTATIAGATDVVSAVFGLDSHGRETRRWNDNAAARRQFEDWIRAPARLSELWAAVPRTTDPALLAELEDAIYRLEHFPPLPSSKG
jgi:hypothetical protein